MKYLTDILVRTRATYQGHQTAVVRVLRYFPVPATVELSFCLTEGDYYDQSW